MNTLSAFPYACEMIVSFPTVVSANRTKEVMNVDHEPGDRVVKTIEIVPSDLSTMRV